MALSAQVLAWQCLPKRPSCMSSGSRSTSAAICRLVGVPVYSLAYKGNVLAFKMAASLAVLKPMTEQDPVLIHARLLELSHEFGQAGWTILGEGNTSGRIDDSVFAVKSSGSSLATLTETE